MTSLLEMLPAIYYDRLMVFGRGFKLCVVVWSVTRLNVKYYRVQKCGYIGNTSLPELLICGTPFCLITYISPCFGPLCSF